MTSLPSLGPRGEGWVVLQFTLIALLALAGIAGPAWPEGARAWLRAAAVPLFVGAAILMFGGSLVLGRQLTPLPRPVSDGSLRQDGLYARARHPIYGGVLLLGLAWSLVTSPLVLPLWAIASWFLEAKRRREEIWLLEMHPEYEEYRRRVRWRFIPYLW